MSAAARTSSSSAAEFIGPTQNHVRALVDELRLTRNGAHQDRIAGGTQEIALGVARQLRRRVVVGWPVRWIVQDRGHGAIRAGERAAREALERL